jgi:hypothetical protein
MMSAVRWVLWLPLALLASMVAGAAGTWFAEFHEGSPWFVWTTSGAVSAWAYFSVAFRVAPTRSSFVKWISVLVLGAIGVMAALGPLMKGTEPVRSLTGAVMAVFAIYYARLPVSDIKTEMDAIAG